MWFSLLCPCDTVQITIKGLTHKPAIIVYHYEISLFSISGKLNLSQCDTIKSCFQPVANYDHLFSIGFNDGRVVRFSASSCEKKSKWVSLLYKYRFNGNIEVWSFSIYCFILTNLWRVSIITKNCFLFSAS